MDRTLSRMRTASLGVISTGPHVRQTARQRERSAVGSSGGLVDVDSVDELCEELLHLQGTQIQCPTSDMERKQDLDVTADGEEHDMYQMCKCLSSVWMSFSNDTGDLLIR
ncbi:hypothetical protein PAMP_007882 [Pampus punctatissimus]